VIGRLSGVLAEKRPEAVVVDVGGVGYEVRVPLSTFLELPDEGKSLRLRIHTHVREDALQLYGFLTDLERAMFKLLLGISGVGPRLALAVLSGLPAARLVQAVRAQDAAPLRGIPGVGAKTAERILIELRGRVDGVELGETGEPGEAPRDDAEEATLSALVNLGYPRAQAERIVRSALERLPANPPLDALIREALRSAAR
jgi:holliday junction DNA helicase RuvA